VLLVEALVAPELVCANEAEQPAPHESVVAAQARLLLQLAVLPPPEPLQFQL
jgi:hypothetical protein